MALNMGNWWFSMVESVHNHQLNKQKTTVIESIHQKPRITLSTTTPGTNKTKLETTPKLRNGGSINSHLSKEAITQEKPIQKAI